MVAADVVPVDTTGLPPGATFGVSGGVRGTSSVGSTGVSPLPTRLGPLTVGEAFGPRYHIIKLLGAGGMGAVYQAWDAELNVAVALKVIRTGHQRSATPEAERRFKNELLLARQVTHKNVVRIHDLGEIDGIKYITMPYIHGEDLRTTLRRDGRLEIALALRIARQLAAGLEAAHDAGVVHRDLKPANVMITVEGVDVQAQIMDFGISVSAADAPFADALGTLEYMAPEQTTGDPVDARADIYAFGLIAYEMLTGPRSAPSPSGRFEAMQLRCIEGLAPLRTLDPAIPEPLAAVIMRCVELDPAARYQTTKELCAALAELDEHGEPIPHARSLTPRLMAATGIIVSVLLGATFFLGQQAVEVPVQHDPVTVVIADFENRTSDPAFDRTLEPMVVRALEGAGFISAYDRNGITRTLGVQPPERLDEVKAREIAVLQGMGVVLSGSIEREGSGFGVTVKAAQPVTGDVITTAQGRAASRDGVLEVATRLVTRVRTALGDNESESRQLFALTSLSATSLDVVRLYAAAQEAMSNGQFDEARQNALKAVAIDPKFGVGYQVLAVSSRNLGQLQDAEKYINEAIQYIDQMTDREKWATRGFYFRVTGDYEQCVKAYGELLARYAADVVGHNQLALCSSYLRDMRRAVDEMQQVVKMLPNRALFRGNLALYANYAGDFETGEREARAIQEPFVYAPLALAFAQLGQRQLPQARETYEKLGVFDALGASLAASGLGDLATLEGRFSDAVRILAQGAEADLAAKSPDRAAAKFGALAYAELSRGNRTAALAAVDNALTNSKAVRTRFVAARTFVAAGELARARPLIASLASELQAEPQAYAKIVEGEAALAGGDARQAIKLLTEANALLDTWIGHFALGRAYLEAGAFIQADSEFDRCLKRSGEALALFLDEEPTFAYFPQVYYYQGRVREGLKNAGFAESYRAYLAFRGQSKEDPLLAHVRRGT
jgi:tetratricopeptide (TPR) repeat protein